MEFGFRHGAAERRTGAPRPVARCGWLPLGLTIALVAGSALAGGDWNDGAVAWVAYEQGLEQAKESGKPVCLVFYTEWCPHCTAYARVFHDPQVVEKSKSFVMVRLNKDRRAELSERYAPDGQYIPRTYFLSSEGELDVTLDARREKYKYFYHESDPASLLAGMERALAKFEPAAE